MFPFPVLVCDVGGTNCRFALAERPGEEARALVRVRTNAFPAFTDAARVACAEAAVAPASLIVCAAGPLQGRSLRLTNAGWTMAGPDIARQLGLQQGLLLNDFEALALSLPVLEPHWLRAIGAVDADPGRPQIVLGPGTGLGMASLAPWGDRGPARAHTRYMALASEAGHVDFAPADDLEARIWTHLRRNHARITPETILSGQGLMRLHRARLAVEDAPPAASVNAPARITALALADPQSQEAATVRLFWRLTARFSGDVALTLFARGGVILAGGILPRIVELLDEAAFRAAFEAKEPMADLMRSIPVRLLERDGAVLQGMAAIAADPDRYLIDYAARAWR